MRVVGLDVSTSTGMAFVTPGSDPAGWRALAMQTEGESIWAGIDDYEFALRDLLAAEKPDFAVIERPIEVVVDHGAARAVPPAPGKPQKRMINATTTITLSALAGNTMAVLNSLGIPYGMIAVATWHATYFGKGVKPDGDFFSPVLGAEPPPAWTRDWKDLAILHAERQGVALPAQKKAKRDAAEAVGIACSWQACTFIPARHQRAFMNLRTSGKAAA